MKQKIVNWLIHSQMLLVVQAILHPSRVWRYWHYKLSAKKPHVIKLEPTLKAIATKRMAVVRYGDGELRWMLDTDSYAFQHASPQLAQRLKAILEAPAPKNCAICVPDVFNGLGQYVPQNQDAWMALLGRYYASWQRYLLKQLQFYDANLSRFYIDRRDKNQAGVYFGLLTKIWAGRDVLIVEGTGTRLGVGNDLLASARSIRRIICPAENAFNCYEEILSTVEQKVQPDDVVLIALGPTATVLAYDLAKLNLQAVDIGHADLEYEWYLQGARDRVNIAGRYVNEIAGGQVVVPATTDEYNRQIIATIKGV
ncbi:GT-D fold domain-containing glycosyltransferase [Lacticaseibacillus suibinensis]|uniref:GT-D fold domain-containing glycosyltransferase n=1 Tax=Lacticaseibacillus suibinensis TaxID=2486011 RepID=UPI001942093F|nr:GT-D fold domain-containing glycosyltransferase [Lacticaseibacillus suibinensis]